MREATSTSRVARPTPLALALVSACIWLISLIAATPAWAGTTASAPSEGAPATTGLDAPSTRSESVESQLAEDVDRRLAERRDAMLKEAQQAIAETYRAIEALDGEDTDAALEALARATGKLELIVARDPELSLAPFDMSVVTHDLVASAEDIERTRERAIELLEAGRIPEARELLRGLASEIVVAVTNLPIASYPDAIKAATPLIDAGRIDEARSALHAALNTLVVTRHVIPLPTLRAGALVDEAETLLNADADEDAEVEGPDRVETARALLLAARRQLDVAEALGYVEPEQVEAERRRIASHLREIGRDDAPEGFLSRMWASFD